MNRTAVASLVAMILVGALSALFLAPIRAIPAFTGDASADFTGAFAIKLDDPSTSPGVPDVGLPVPPFAAGDLSGWDMNAVYFEYDSTTDTLYVGIDCFTVCGDADSDGDPGAAGANLSSLGGTDPPDLGDFESITLLIDTDNDFAGGTGNFEVAVGVPLMGSLANLGAYNFVGTPAASHSGYTTPLTNTVTLFASPSASAPDFEFSIARFSTLPGFTFTPGTDFTFAINLFAGSLVDDGIGEDYLPSPNASIPVQPPVPTPTPTDTPTATPSDTPLPTDTPTVTPTMTLTPTATPTAPPTETPQPSPTDTATPPAPTEVPTTGADLTWVGEQGARGQGARSLPLLPRPPLQSPLRLLGALPSNPWIVHPQRLVAPAIGLDTSISPMGWSLKPDPDGTLVSRWDVVDYVAGWHINSALPGAVGNAVLSGHNNMGGAVFRNLHKLKPGDAIEVWVDDEQPTTYIVDEVSIVPETFATAAQRAQNAAMIAATDDERLTLVTCWPAYSNTHRVFVVAHPQLRAEHRPR